MTPKHAIFVAIALSFTGCGGGALSPHGGPDGGAGTGGVAGAGGTTSLAGAGGQTGLGGAGGQTGFAGNGGATGVAGTGGATGVAGTGGMTGVAGTGGTAPVAPPKCDLAFESGTAAVPLDATVTCDVPFYDVQAALGSNRGVHLLTTHQPSPYDAPQTLYGSLVASGRTGSVERVSPEIRVASLLVDSTGVPHLAGADRNGRLLFLRRAASVWTAINTPAFDPEVEVGGATFGPDDTAMLIIVDASSTRSFLTKPPAPSTWTKEPMALWDPPNILVDSKGRAQVVAMRESSGTLYISRWSSGLTDPEIVDTFTGSPGDDDVVHVVALDGDRYAISYGRPPRFLVSAGNGTFKQYTAPQIELLAVRGCSAVPNGMGTCRDQGRGVLAVHGLARTSDGKLWLAYVEANVDRDVSYLCSPFESTRICDYKTTADRTTTDVVLVAVAFDDEGGTFPPDVRWRHRMANDPKYQTVMSARGTDLAITFANAAVANQTTSVRQVIVDTTKL